MNLVSIDTTDNQWLGLHFELPDPLAVDYHFPVAPDTSFRVDKAEALGNGIYRFSNPHYVVIAREVV
jgi:hypothetical protein